MPASTRASKAAKAAAATVGPKAYTFDFTGLSAADWSSDTTKAVTSDGGTAFTWGITDQGSDMDTSNFGPDGSGLVLGTNGGGTSKSEYGANHNGVGLEIAVATLFPAVARGESVELAVQWADANASATNWQELVIQFHDNASSRDSLGLAYNHGIGVRTVKRLNNSGSNQGAVQTTPSSTPPTLMSVRLIGDNFGEGFFANTGALGAPLTGTFVARPELVTTETGAGGIDITAARIRITAGSHSSTGWPPKLEKIRVSWWPKVTT